MKCVRTKAGKIMRLPNKAAIALVLRGEAVFVPKACWKEAK